MTRPGNDPILSNFCMFNLDGARLSSQNHNKFGLNQNKIRFSKLIFFRFEPKEELEKLRVT